MANSCKNISTSFTTVISFGTVRQIFPVVQSEFLTFSNSVVWWIEYQVGRVGIVSRYVEKTALNMILHRWVDNVVLVVCNGYTNILLRVMGKSVTAPQCWPSIPHAFKTISTNVLQFYTRYNSINLHIKCAILVILCSKADVWLNQIPIAYKEIFCIIAAYKTGVRKFSFFHRISVIISLMARSPPITDLDYTPNISRFGVLDHAMFDFIPKKRSLWFFLNEELFAHRLKS